MKKLYLWLTSSLLCAAASLTAQDAYQTQQQINKSLTSLHQAHMDVTILETIAKSPGGHEIMALTVGNGDAGNQPAIAVVAGIEGPDINSSELAVRFAGRLLENTNREEVQELLKEVTFYILPVVNPDAREQFFSGLQYERTANGKATDNDRDGALDEDGFNDLNNDGMISMMRIADPAGEYITHPEDNRLMIKADPAKGQKGAWIYLTEGIDDDGDGEFNEDAAGGVCINRNLSYNYEEFGKEAGVHAVSETETRKVLDFLYDRWNTYAVFSIQPEDNLLKPLRFNPSKARGRKVETILKEDELINKLVSNEYKKIMQPEDYTPAAASPGNFRDWVYFHYGRYAFSAPAWHAPGIKGKEAEEALLAYAEEAGTENLFIPWQSIDHPGFPGKKVEIGGIRPFAASLTAESKLDEQAEKYTEFLLKIAQWHPEIQLMNLETEDLGNNLYRIKVQMHNTGIFGTSPKVGEPNKFVRRIRLEIELSKGQELLSGTPVQAVTRLNGDSYESFTWLIKGKGSIKISAGAPAGGFDTVTKNL